MRPRCVSAGPASTPRLADRQRARGRVGGSLVGYALSQAVSDLRPTEQAIRPRNGRCQAACPSGKAIRRRKPTRRPARRSVGTAGGTDRLVPPADRDGVADQRRSRPCARAITKSGLYSCSHGRLAQLVRARGSHPRGHWFESSIAHHPVSTVRVAACPGRCSSRPRRRPEGLQDHDQGSPWASGLRRGVRRPQPAAA